jgi:hypothetical protein
MPSGMGVRFLTADELLEELLPAIDFQAEERIPAGIESPAGSISEAASKPPSGVFHAVSSNPPPGSSATVHRGLDEAILPPPQPRAAAAAPAAASAPPGPAPARPASAAHPPAGPAIGSVANYPLRFRDADQFRRVFDRDVKTGGLFIHTSRPAALDAIIQVEVTVEGLDVTPVRLQARVVHRMEPPAGSESGNLLAGMGVQFVDASYAVEQLRSLLR